MIMIDGEVIDAILVIAKVGASIILAWMIAMTTLVLLKTRRTKVNGK